MTEKKKRKSIYDKPLRDINKDGKVNFGDTWLGDALGFDGKMGIQKGRPGLRDSLKGARRGKAESKEDKPAKRSSSSRSRPRSRTTDSGMDDKAAATRRATSGSKDDSPKTPRSSTGGPARYGTRSRTGKMREKLEEKFPSEERLRNVQAKSGSGLEGAINRATQNQSDARAKAIETARTERANKPSEAEIQTWIKKKLTDRAWSKKHQTTASRREAAIEALSGMAKGGIAMKKEGRYQQNGGRDMKKTGMFYKSGSPRGYK